MDFADMAAEREAIHRQEALARVGLKKQPGESRRFCLACGEAIPEARRLAVPGVQYCIQCQTENEHADLQAL